jgi:hypothetical protein
LRARIAEELYDGLKDSVPGVYDALCQLEQSEGVPADLRKEIASRLASRRALAGRATRRKP